MGKVSYLPDLIEVGRLGMGRRLFRNACYNWNCPVEESDLDLGAVGGRVLFVWIYVHPVFHWRFYVFPPERFFGFSHWLPADGSSVVLDLVFSFVCFAWGCMFQDCSPAQFRCPAFFFPSHTCT